ncbi:MAG: hypothetical protein AB1671_22430 [Thermodesulfobacteriota bacterium]|jgi:hypothetical protein
MRRSFYCWPLTFEGSLTTGLGLCLIASGVIFFHFSPTPGVIRGADDTHYFSYLPSLVIDRGLDVANQIDALQRVRHSPASDPNSVKG